MTYQQTLDWLFKQLPTYQLQGKVAYKADLSNIVKLANYLGDPHKKIKFIHVAGTNGKGSVSHILSSVLQESGYKVGLYTSPHLVDFRERIKINKEEIPQSYVVNFVAEHKLFFEQNQLSFFEMTVGLAFQYFYESSVDIAVIEVGLGGRLDATNIITPELSVITNIGLDHMNFLGDTYEKIAFEKAGIIKKEIPVVVSEYTEKTKPVFLAKATEENAPIHWASDTVHKEYKSDLLGDYQKNNIKAVVQAVNVLHNQGVFCVSEESLVFGLNKVVINTGLKGRWQIVQEHPTVVCDTAHNKEGLTIVMDQIRKMKYQDLYFVFGMVDDKDVNAILPLLPKEAYYFFTKPGISRGLDAVILYGKAMQLGLKGEVVESVYEAYNQAMAKASKDDFIYIGGSTFVVGDFLSKKSCNT